MKFKIGDKVRYISKYDGSMIPLGSIGIIKEIRRSDEIGVDFAPLTGYGLHFMGGALDRETGYWLEPSNIELVRKPRAKKALIMPESIFQQKATGFKYGIELETIVPYDDYSSAISDFESIGFSGDGDGSIEYSDDEEGLEVKNSSPVDYSTLISQADSVENMASNYGLRINTSCGFHLHTSNEKFFKKKYLSRIVSTWIAIEDFMYSTQPDSRQNNQYCRKHFNNLLTDYFDNIPNSKSALIDKYRSKDRYFSLNLKALYDHGTIECRLHAGTLSSRKIKAWVYLMTAFYNYCLSEKFSKKEIEKLYMTNFTQDKVKRIYKMLDIPMPLRYYFNRRINKMAVKGLQIERFRAIKAYPLIKNIKKAQQKAEKARSELLKEQSEFEHKLSNSEVEFNQLELGF